MKLTTKDNSKNYACSIVVIKNIFPIEGADNIVRTNINGNDVVVSKDVQIGEIMLYFVSGTRLNPEYCTKNNLLDKAEMNYDTSKRGFISHKQFRVKAIKLRGVISDGILIPLDSLIPFLEGYSIRSLKIGDEFTDINGNSLCEKYIVPVRNSNPGGKAPKQPKRISRLIEDQFFLHNDTHNLRKNMHKINPNDIIGIHFKKHGTSAVFGNVLVKKNLKWYEKLAKKIGINITETEYDIVYSSRNVVKNAYLNTGAGEGFYREDIWGIVAQEIKHLIPCNWTIYGEILGYLPYGGAIQSMKNKSFDYGCKIGEHKFYVYKISIVNPDGKVIFLTDKQIEEYCEKVGLLYKDTFIYYGKASNYFDYAEGIGKTVELTEKDNLSHTNIGKWRELFLQHLEQLHNEKDCYMCINKVPEEGIVLRVEKAFEYEAYKLKSKRFLLGESEEQEKENSNIEDNQ